MVASKAPPRPASARPLKSVGESNRIKKQTRLQVQAELRSVLADTAQLTRLLQQQITELHDKGWNRGGKQAL